MIKKICFVILITAAFGMRGHVSAQRTIVSSDPTIRDKFGKKIGSLMFSAATLKFGRLKNNVVQRDTIRFFNSGSRILNLSLGKSPVHLSLVLQSSSIAPKSEGWIAVTFDAQKKNDYGFVLDRFELFTNDSVQPKKTLSVTAIIGEAFPLMTADDSANAPKARWKETAFDYGKIKQGEKITREFAVYNDGKKNLLIHKAKTDCSCLKTSISKSVVAPGDSSVVKVEFDSSGKEGKDVRKVDVYLNDYLKPYEMIVVKGEVTR